MSLINLDKMRNLEIQSDDLNSDEYSDEDIDEFEIKSIFHCPLLLDKQVNKSTYILHLAGNSETHPKIAAGLSNNTCNIYDFKNSNLVKLATISDHNDSIIGVKFCNNNNNLLYTGSSDGTIKIWDIRDTREPKITLVDETCEETKGKPFSCFDISTDGRLLCAGTNLIDSDAFMLFWDIRRSKLLGAYWESHTDDITQVKFTPDDDMNKLLSASVDGYINLYDIQQSSEEEAIIDTLNTESSVESVTWHPDHFISCVTHTADVLIWKIDDVQPQKSFNRTDIGKAIKRSSGNNIYVLNLLPVRNGFLLLAGSNKNDGECFRGLKVNFSGQVQPAYSFSGNEQIVRSCWLSKNEKTLFTGGEKGIINVWNLSEK